MKKFTLTFLLNAVLLIALGLSAEARMTIGFTPEASPADLNQFSKELTNLAGTAVKIKRFEDDAAVANWLIRFQELDAAIVGASFIRQHPAGALNQLVDLHSQKSSLAPLALVVRSNLASNEQEQIKQLFLNLGASKTGRKALLQLGLAGTTLPGGTRPKPLAPPSPASKKVLQQPAPIATKQPVSRPEPGVETKPAAKVPGQAKAKPQPRATVAPTPAKQAPAKEQTSSPAPTLSPQAKSKQVETPAAQAPPPATEAKQTAPAPPPASETRRAPGEQPSDANQISTSPQPEVKEVKSEETSQKPETNKRLTLFIALVILVAIGLKSCLLVLRWKKKQAPAVRPEDTPASESSFRSLEPIAPKDLPTKPVDNVEEAIIEEGRLGPGKVPQLLKRCANLPRPVVLHITKGSCTKLVYFAGGQVSGALTQHSTNEASTVRWNKLGSLLIREELITSEERDQGMALLEAEPQLRFGEALLKLGLIDLSGLRHALTRQAKVTIYSLILYPEGRYQIFAGDGDLPPEESVSLEISALIREASHHQSEWTAIRQALPNLNTALEFCPEGRKKLDNVSLSPQQEETLTHIDGNRTINEVCIASSMMDYEVYRLLYLMVKAGVLK